MYYSVQCVQIPTCCVYSVYVERCFMRGVPNVDSIICGSARTTYDMVKYGST